MLPIGRYNFCRVGGGISRGLKNSKWRHSEDFKSILRQDLNLKPDILMGNNPGRDLFAFLFEDTLQCSVVIAL